jgi:hypothetical protein
LSDDYFRFIWDGRLFAHGYNPFDQIPSNLLSTEIANKVGLDGNLYQGLNSPNYFTIYPPMLQFVFGLGAKIFPSSILGNIIVMRLFILGAEIGSIFLMKSLLKRFKLDTKNVLLYALNPLVIFELTGNIHFEAFMIFFILLALNLLFNKRFILSAIIFGFAVCSKLLPLLFLPLLLRYLGWRKTILYSGIVIFTTIILFVPFIDSEFLNHIFSSTGLYFQKFEFNAGIFYLIRWVGYLVKGYDIIQIAAPILSILTFIIIMIVSLRKKNKNETNLIQNMLLGLTVYFMLATIVHPWYITTLVALSVFTKFRFPIAWSVLIMLSYFTYRSVPYQELQWAVAIEYLLLGIVILIDLRRKNRPEEIMSQQQIKIPC